MRKTTILRQLLLNITIPVVLVLFAFSYTNYRYNKAELEENVKHRFEQIIGEAKDLVGLHDYAMKVNEKHFEQRMRDLSAKLIKKFDTELDPRTTDLYKLSLSLGLDTNTESIYFIDTNGVIINTTFHKDYLLDFYARGAGYREYFEKIWAKNSFVADRFSTEQVTGKIRKWSFEPTANKLYLMELGFLSPEAKSMRDMFIEKVNGISKKYPDILRLSMHLQIKGEKFGGIEDTLIQRKMQEVLLSKKNQRVITELDDKTVFEDIISLPAEIDETSMFSGIVLYIKSDDTKERAVLNSAIYRFIYMATIAIVVLLIILIFRARTITKPIKRLSQKTELISSGKLNERIEVEGKNEIAQLSQNFNTMIEQLQDSYETLEQKVKDRTAEVVQQKDIIEEKHKEITDSINYAERIQRSFLTPEENLKANLKNYFILFQPKDIVSGDFYWGEKLKNGNYLMAVADSTGHGVPGAIMSLLNLTSLENAVNEGLVEPAEILNYTRKTIIERLKKDGSAEGGRDGMDCSLLSFNFEKRTLSFSLANNPVWIIRDSKLIEYAPDKMPVGKHDKQDTPFSQKEIELLPNDLIYTFTDGYADQFGGEKGKKFKYSNIQKLLLEIQHLSLAEQKTRLLVEFENWKGNLEQLDDVCIFGIKI